MTRRQIRPIRARCLTAPRRRPAPIRRDSDWISIAQASDLLGINQATLRRWADDGRVPVYMTPGGHRRFARHSLDRVLAEQHSRRPALARLGASPERLARAYRASATNAAPNGPPWLEHLSEADRLTFRERGRAMLGLLIDHLDASEPAVAAATLQAARLLAVEHGRLVRSAGASMSEAVQGFLQYRAPFLSELGALARRRALNTAQATELLAAAEAAMDQLLIATLSGYTAAGGPRRRPRPGGPASDRTADPPGS